MITTNPSPVPAPTLVRAPNADPARGLTRSWWTTSWIAPSGRGVQLSLWRERGHYCAAVRAATFRPDPSGGWFASGVVEADQHTWSAGRSTFFSPARLARLNAEISAALNEHLARAGRSDLLAILAQVARD